MEEEHSNLRTDTPDYDARDDPNRSYKATSEIYAIPGAHLPLREDITEPAEPVTTIWYSRNNDKGYQQLSRDETFALSRGACCRHYCHAATFQRS